jgi:hypothetical protein
MAALTRLEGDAEARGEQLEEDYIMVKHRHHTNLRQHCGRKDRDDGHNSLQISASADTAFGDIEVPDNAQPVSSISPGMRLVLDLRIRSLALTRCGASMLTWKSTPSQNVTHMGTYMMCMFRICYGTQTPETVRALLELGEWYARMNLWEQVGGAQNTRHGACNTYAWHRW